MVDPAGRLADLARHISDECDEMLAQVEGDLVLAGYLADLANAADAIAARYSGYTEMPDAKRERNAP